MIKKRILTKLYIEEHHSMKEMSQILSCSEHKIEYWMRRHNIARRDRSEATYVKYHPNGDPFKVKIPQTQDEIYLTGLAVGLYWGEGTKSSKHAIRLGNTDPALLRYFIRFLEEIFGLDRKDLKFGLQIFSDIDVKRALDYWTTELSIKPEQFWKPIVTLSGKLGTYRQKSEFGVLTVHYNNKKLRDILVQMLPR